MEKEIAWERIMIDQIDANIVRQIEARSRIVQSIKEKRPYRVPEREKEALEFRLKDYQGLYKKETIERIFNELFQGFEDVRTAKYEGC
jgi:chorismate mutase